MRRFNLLMVMSFASLMILGSVITAAASPVRIVVLPFYVEEGVDVSKGEYKTHYRRTMRQINNHLDRNDFEVINPFAKESIEKEYDRVAERAREDSVLAVREVCEKYGVDVAYIVWLKVKMRKTADGYYKATAIIDGEGYDAGGRDLGVGLTETFKVTRRDRDEAGVEVEKYAGDLVGQMLTTWRRESGDQYAVATPASGTSSPSEGRLMQNSRKHENTLQVRLDGATDYEIAEVFGKILNSATGVVDAKRVGGSIVRNNPQASYAAWRVEIDGEMTESFRLEANIMKMIHDVMESGGNLELKGVPYRYSQDEIRQLQGVHPGKSNARQLQFMVDRSETIEREMTGGKGFN